MKIRSISFKITLWFTLVLIIILTFTYFVILSISNKIIQKSIKDTLIETVQNNLDDFEYHSSIDKATTNGVDHLIHYGNGYLQISVNFLQHINGVYTGLYQEDFTLIYGEDPISIATKNLSFHDSIIQSIKIDDTLYYVFDKKIPLDRTNNLWLRGIISEKQGTAQIYSITKLSLITFPMIVFISSIIGYMMIKRMLNPIHKMSATAVQIGKEGDFKVRIGLEKGKDELHELANSFDNMLEKLEDAFLKEQQFTSDASHELRTPISVISAQCQLSLGEKRSIEEYQKDLQVIERQSKKMEKLINDMLDFTRLEMKSQKYIMEPVDLTQLVSSVCLDMSLIKEREISLTCKVDENISCIGNYELLSRAIINLISNAYRYGKEKGSIFVNLFVEEDQIKLTVQDDGIGIKQDEQDKIFHRFYQSDTSRTGEGNGLGLAMVYEIVKFHGGSIYVTSQLGKGSTFTITLPRKK